MPDPDAAAPPDTPPAPRPFTVRDLGRDLLRPSRSQFVLAVVLCLCALAVTIQVQSRATDDQYSTLRRAELVSLLDDLQADNRRLESEIADLEATERRLKSGVDASQLARDEARRRLDSLGLLAGTTPARGPGIRIVISDPAAKVTPEIVLNAIEELRDAGAEVIEVNDRIRLVASSWVGGTAGDLVMDGVAAARPLSLDVIGNPRTLAEATRFRGGLVSTIEAPRVGGEVSVTELTEVTIDAVVGSRTLRFARPA